MASAINSHYGMPVDEDTSQISRERRPDNYESFLSVYPSSNDGIKHRRTASMRSDIGSRRQPLVKPPCRTGSASEIANKSGDSAEQEVLREPARLQRVRSFTKTPKGLINRGDSIRRRHDAMNNKAECVEERNVCIHEKTPSYFRVAVLGASKVGKSSLVCQFMTSEYMGATETNQVGEQTVSVIVDGTESTVNFVDQPENQNIPPQEQLADGYLVVYSLTDKRSFKTACDLIAFLRQDANIEKAIILVANKNDLVRKRKVPEHEGKRCAHAHDCTYMETSAAICHNVDELLVRIVGDLRKQTKASGHAPRDNKIRSSGSLKDAKRSLRRSATSLIRRVFSSQRRPKTTEL